MITLIKQYRQELRNIVLLVLAAFALPYVPQVFHFLATQTGTIICIALLSGFIIGMSLKVHYRILLMRIANEK